MDNSEFKLFDDDGSIKLPSSENAVDTGEELKSEKVDNALFGETVKTLLIPEEEVLDKDNFVIDFSKSAGINVLQKMSLSSLMSTNGDTTIYLLSKGSLLKVGVGDSVYLEEMMPIMKNSILPDDVKIYKNVQVGGKLHEVMKRDITKLRMRI